MAKRIAHVPAKKAPQHDDADIIRDGDYAGMRSDDVLRALTDGIHSLFAGEGEIAETIGVGGVDLPTAGAALDLALGEYLQLVEGAIGPHNAKVAALAFCQTALPYASLDIPVTTTYAEARKIKGHRK